MPNLPRNPKQEKRFWGLGRKSAKEHGFLGWGGLTRAKTGLIGKEKLKAEA
jgi:hypothetical protein